MQIPKQLRWNFIRPKGFNSEYYPWVINPMGGQSKIMPTQILRYSLNLTQGFFDPYRSHFEIQVQTAIPTGCLQIDSSAHGFISQSLVVVNTQQVQRISQYDQLACILVSRNYSPIFAVGRQYQGLGRMFMFNNSKQTPTSNSNNATQLSSLGVTSPTLGQYQNWYADISTNYFNPLTLNSNQPSFGGQYQNHITIPKPAGQQNSSIKKLAQKIQTNSKMFKKKQISLQSLKAKKYQSYSKQLQNAIIAGVSSFNFENVLGSSSSLVSCTNWALYVNAYSSTIKGRKNGILFPRAQYALNTLANKYVDTPLNDIRCYLTGVDMINSFKPTQPNLPYMLKTQSAYPIKYYINCADIQQTNPKAQRIQTTSASFNIHGYQNPYSPQLSVGCQQPFISPTIPQCGMQNGKIGNWIPVDTKRFIIPFISGIMGILIPQQSYALLPLKAFNNTLLQLTLNKYAMFSSGYNDRNERDFAGMQFPIKRDFYFTKFNYVLQIYLFQDQGLQAYAQQSLRKGIIFSSQSYQLGSINMLAGQLKIRTTFQINTTAANISQIMIRFLDNRYLQYPFLRKQYALSGNITSWQIKYDTRFFPPQPIVGNAGNPQYLDTTGNVQPFLQRLYNAQDLVFNKAPMPIINQLNFAINSRIFDVTNTNTFLPKTQDTDKQFSTYNTGVWDRHSVNGDTAMGLSWFHQNRCVGRALYVYSFQPNGHSKGLITGISGNVKQFEIKFDTSVIDPFPGQIGMYSFVKYHQIIQLTEARGVRTYQGAIQ